MSHHKIKKNDDVKLNARKESELSQVELPKLGHQLTMTQCPKVAGIEDWVCIAPTISQRLRRFALVFAEGFCMALLALTVLYVPDFVADYSHRGADFVAFFGKFFLIAVLFVSISAFIVVLMRDVVIFVSPSHKMLVCAGRLNAKSAVQRVSLSELSGIISAPPEGIFKRSQLLVHVRDTEVILAESQGDNEDLIAVRDWLMELKAED